MPAKSSTFKTAVALQYRNALQNPAFLCMNNKPIPMANPHLQVSGGGGREGTPSNARLASLRRLGPVGLGFGLKNKRGEG